MYIVYKRGKWQDFQMFIDKGVKIIGSTNKFNQQTYSYTQLMSFILDN